MQEATLAAAARRRGGARRTWRPCWGCCAREGRQARSKRAPATAPPRTKRGGGWGCPLKRRRARGRVATGGRRACGLRGRWRQHGDVCGRACGRARDVELARVCGVQRAKSRAWQEGLRKTNRLCRSRKAAAQRGAALASRASFSHPRPPPPPRPHERSAVLRVRAVQQAQPRMSHEGHSAAHCTDGPPVWRCRHRNHAKVPTAVGRRGPSAESNTPPCVPVHALRSPLGGWYAHSSRPADSLRRSHAAATACAADTLPAPSPPAPPPNCCCCCCPPGAPAPLPPPAAIAVSGGAHSTSFQSAGSGHASSRSALGFHPAAASAPCSTCTRARADLAAAFARAPPPAATQVLARHLPDPI